MFRPGCNAAVFLLLAIVASRVSLQAQKAETTDAQKKQVTVLKYVFPIYPAIAKTTRISGDVTLVSRSKRTEQFRMSTLSGGLQCLSRPALMQ